MSRELKERTDPQHGKQTSLSQSSLHSWFPHRAPLKSALLEGEKKPRSSACTDPFHPSGHDLHSRGSREGNRR